MNEDDYSKPLHGYEADETRDLFDLALDFVQVLLILGFLTFAIFGLIGVWSAM